MGTLAEQPHRHSAEYQARFQSIFDYTEDHIFGVSQDGTILYLNKPGPGLTAEDVIGSNLFDFQAPDMRKTVEKAVAHVFEHGRPSHYVTTLKLPKGTRTYECQVTPCVQHGAVHSATIVARDVTKKLQYEAELQLLNQTLERRIEEGIRRLQKTNKELEAFAYSVSHDLRAPLRAITGYASILEEDHREQLDEDAQQCIETIIGEATRMAQLIDDLLTFSRMQRREANWEPVDMGLLFEEVVTDFREHHPGLMIDFRVDALPRIKVDISMIKVVWTNLLSNAVKYSKAEQKPRIHVFAREQGEEAVFAMQDEGVGFDMRYYDKLFQVFQRLHTEEEYEGTGIGLALVQKIVERHDGRVWAESEPGKGATFFFSLPLKQDE